MLENELNLFRRKTAMVLHDIEIEIGNLVLEKQELLEKENKNQSSVLIPTKDLVEQSYLDELFQLILPATKGTNLESDIIDLRNLFLQNEIFHIRNVIAHPNRPPYINYWYKVATLASEPIIDILGLTQIQKTLLAAESNSIIDPPDEWLVNIFSKLPNNIPERFEHSITGLIGRNEIVSTLQKSLINKLDRRSLTVSLVAPGGSGKTAIVLETLRRIVDDYSAKEHFDACVYVTMKQEELTDNGIKKLEAVQSVLELEKEITEILNDLLDTEYEDFASLKNGEEHRKLILCIDNLETLLIDNSEEFDSFLADIPLTWKILITSRISIDNSKIIRINDLKKQDAIQLARTYLIKRNGGLNEHKIDEIKLKKIAEMCFFNPLAIRLTIDLYLKGGSIDSSIQCANKEIAQFSFRNLIDSLSEDAIRILECLYIKPNITRVDLRDILNLSEDEIAENIQQLSNTSLIIRKTNDDSDTYKLGESISNLLLANPRNIEIRGRIQNDIAQRAKTIAEHEKQQKRLGIERNSINYIDDKLPSTLKILLLDLNKKIKSMRRKRAGQSQQATELLERFQQIEKDFIDTPEYHIGFGRLLNELNAFPRAISRFEKALELDKNSLIAKYFLAISYFLQKNTEKSAELLEELYFYKNKSDELDELITDYLFRSLMYSNNFEKTLELTKEWKESRFRGIQGSYRARAIKVSVESISNVDERAKGISRSIATLNDVLRNDGYIKCASLQVRNICNEIAMLLLTKPEYRKCGDSVNWLDFIKIHTPEIKEYLSYPNRDCNFLIDFIEYMHSNGKKNPFSSVYWANFLNDFKSEDKKTITMSKNITDKHIIVTVERQLKDGDKLQKFIFARSDDDTRFFIHLNALKNETLHSWRELQAGSKLAIIPDWDNIEEEKDIVAKEGFILSI